MVHIIKSSPPLDPELLSAFAGQSVATVHEAMGRRGAMDGSIRPIAPGMRACGRALTVRCHPGDNLMLIKAVSMARPGDILVCDMGKIVHQGPFGEVLAVECLARGIRGLVVSSGVRDSVEIAALGFPVFSAGFCVCGTAKATLGTINHTIALGGEVVRPGDLVLADNDGVVVVPREEAPQVLEAAKARVAKEAAVMERLRNGESLWDINGYQPVLEGLGCVEE